MSRSLSFVPVIAAFSVFAFVSCTPEAFEASGPPLPPTPIYTDSLINGSAYSLNGQTWVIEHYRVGLIGEINLISDTLYFSENGEMIYNEVAGNYAFYPSASAYVLTMYETPWGMLSGSIQSYNMDAGEMIGTPFTNIAPGGNGLQVYLWMRRI
ncbi:MAG: hypothetical protein ACKO7B_08595 [Flavobacteriales bacterium]